MQEPLNTDDDVSEDDSNDMFDTDNVVVCQYDKVIIIDFCLVGKLFIFLMWEKKYSNFLNNR